MILAIDFNGVIHDNKNPIKGKRMGEPMLGADKSLRFLKSRGHKVIVFSTVPEGVIKDFMKYYGLLYDEITNVKPEADIYLDDKAIRFTTWRKFINGI